MRSLLQPRPLHPPPAACLSAERIGLYCLDVTSSSEREQRALRLDEVLDEQLPGSWMTRVRRGCAWLLLDRLELGRDHRAGAERVTQNRSSCSIVAFNWAISVSSSLRPRPRQSTKVMSRMWFACSSLKENGSLMRLALASARSSEARILAITASSMSMARSSPSTMCARASALRRRNCDRLVTNLHLMRDVGLKSLSKIEKARHTVDEGPARVTPKVDCRGVCL